MFTLNAKGRLIILDEPIVMGIINCTPDSFHEGSRAEKIEDAVNKAAAMLEQGAAIIDIGGQTTRPNSVKISAAIELERVIPVIRAILDRFPEALISIDSFYAQVAKEAVDAGAAMVNDVSAGLIDPNMLLTVASLQVPYICMHYSGKGEDLHEPVHSSNITRTVLDFFIERIESCKKAGIKDLIIDPGFGFGKTVAENFKLVKDISILTILEKPILLGVSRKSSIYKTLNGTAETALNGTTVLNTIGLLNGAHILRVHDVKEAVEAIKLVRMVNQSSTD
ncbi:MAG: dihydropteroate synthase [Chitinophagaceae bacterium]|nr:dihydropteroate synthase [Chitinophagaceae bacterium]